VARLAAWTCPRCNTHYEHRERNCWPCLKAICYAEEHEPDKIETAGRLPKEPRPTEKGYLVADSGWVIREVAAHFLKEITALMESSR